jgi:hypothetical protein
VATPPAGLSLLTYDLDTIPELLLEWAQMGRSHAGVLYVDERTIRSRDFGGLVRSIIRIWDTRGHEDWTNVIAFLERA